MDIIYILIIITLLLVVIYLTAREYTCHKRIRSMNSSIENILNGQKKLQIFSEKKDDLAELAFKINHLAALYGTAEEKYEKEQQTKKQLISNLSHDVRTPLVSVIGYLEAIVEKRIDENQEEDYINTAYKKANILKEQINQLFEFVQSDANEIKLSMEKIDVCEITREVLIDFVPVMEGEAIELESSIPDEEIYALADKSSFIRIVQNLVKNTLIHGNEGKYIGVFIKKEEGRIFIDIADKGRGIDKEHLPYVFDRLYKVDNSRTRGGGIGLAIAKELSLKMSGNIEILHSIPGDTVFRITFPEVE